MGADLKPAERVRARQGIHGANGASSSLHDPSAGKIWHNSTRMFWECMGKRAFDDQAQALRAISKQRVKRSPLGKVRPYRCRQCGQWHIGGSF